MSSLKRGIYTGFFILFILNRGYGVDPQFSQFYSNSLYLSPSFAGVNAENRISFNARRQWPNIPNGFTTLSFSYDRNFENINSGLGLLILNDYAGSGQLGSLNIAKDTIR